MNSFRLRGKQNNKSVNYYVLLCAIVVGLSGCAIRDSLDWGAPLAKNFKVPNHRDLTFWKSYSKFSFIQNYNRESEKSRRGRFEWTQDGQNFRIKILGTFGIGFALISGNDIEATIKSRFGEHTAPTAKLLSQNKALPFIPISYIQYWLIGTPHPDAETVEIQKLPNGAFQSFQQVGWKVEIVDRRQFGDYGFPRTIVAQKDSFRIELVTSRWSIEQ